MLIKICKIAFLALVIVLLNTTAGISNEKRYFSQSGVVELSGDFNFSIKKNTGSSTMNLLRLNPSINYFLANGFSIGLQPLTYEISWTEESRLSLFASFATVAYFININQNFFPYLQGLVGYGTVNYSGSYFDDKEETTYFGFATGVRIPVISKGLLNFGLNYYTYNKTNTSQLLFNIGFSIWL
jgi:hypothetical protein